jgi:delta8-fatty-acid desaturase
MKKYRIGRVQEPWTNLEPPIRSPENFYKNLALRKEKGTTYGSEKDWEKLTQNRECADSSPVRLLQSDTMHSGACSVSVC